MTDATLTPKQERVVALLHEGKTVPEVAKSMKISPSGVYGHMRRIRAAGVALPSETVATNGHAKGADPPGTPQGVHWPDANEGSLQLGNNIVIAPEEAIQRAIDDAQARLSEMDNESNELSHRISALDEERQTLVARVERLDAAAQAL